MKLETWRTFADNQNGLNTILQYMNDDISNLMTKVRRLLNLTTDSESTNIIDAMIKDIERLYVRKDKAVDKNNFLKHIVRSDYYNEPLISESEQRQISWNEEVIASEPEEIDWNEDNEVPF